MGIIVKPLVTEKMTSISEKSGRYGFIVSPKANKAEIKKEIEIVKEIINAHHENINVISTVDVGTEFIFTLPKSKKSGDDD